MDINKPRTISQTVSSFKLPNGYILPEGRLTPNTLFVGGIDMKVEEHEMWEFFTRYGNVKEVKIITYREGCAKVINYVNNFPSYGFVYFSEDVNIQSIIEQQIIFKGRKLKLGPAIMKQRIPRSIPTRLVGPTHWISPNHYICCGCCSPVGGGLPQPAPVFNGGSPYNQPFSYSSFGEVMLPQIPMSYTQSPYPYQYTPAPWTPDQRAQPFHQLCGHWSPDYAECAVVKGQTTSYKMQAAAASTSQDAGEVTSMPRPTSESIPTPRLVFRTPSPQVSQSRFNTGLHELSS